MSSSRSVAAARARRAGGSDASRILKPSQTRNTNQKIPMNAPPVPQQAEEPALSSPYDQKLSVSDAFALVTIRLGRVESVLQKLDVNEIASKITSGDDKTSGGANNVLVKTISSRIDDLEMIMKDKISLKEHEEIVSSLKGTITGLKEEILDLKNTTFKLQTMMIDVNQKLLSSFVKEELTKQASSEVNSNAGSEIADMESVSLQSSVNENEQEESLEIEQEISGENDNEDEQIDNQVTDIVDIENRTEHSSSDSVEEVSEA